MSGMFNRNSFVLHLIDWIFLQTVQFSVIPATLSSESEEDLSVLEILYPKDQFCHVILHTIHNEVNLNATFPWTEVPKQKAFDRNTFFFIKTKTTVQVSNNHCKTLNLTSVLLLFPEYLEINMTKTYIVKVNNEQSLKLLDAPFNYTTDPETILPNTYHIIFTNETLNNDDLLDIHTSYKIKLLRIPMQRDLACNPQQLSGPSIILSLRAFPDMPLYFSTLFPKFTEDSLERFKFTLKATHCKRDNTSVVSNMHIEKTTEHPEMKNCFIDHFHKSPSLPAKQIRVLVLSGFQNVTVKDFSTVSNNSRNIRIWTTPEYEVKIGKNVYQVLANDTIKPLHFFQKLLKFEYPLEKLDVIIIPTQIGWHDGYSGLGIITGWNKPFDSIINGILKDFDLLVFSQWIGGVVSAAPINQKFRSHCAFDFEVLLNNYIFWTLKHIENNILDQAWPWWRPGDCYSKEMPVLFMLEAIFSKKVMHSAIADNFLPTMKWKTAQIANFSESIQQSIIQHNVTHLLPFGGNVKQIIDSWTSLGSQFPKILANKTDHSPENLYLSQLELDDSCLSSPSYLWIPVEVLHKSGQDLVWLSPDNHGNNTLNYTIPNYNTSLSELIINPNGSACYFVDYSSNLVADIASQLTQNVSTITYPGRQYQITNIFRLAENIKSAEYVTKALSLLGYLSKEMHTPTLQLAVRSLYSLFNNMKNWGDLDSLEKLFENDKLINQTRTSIGLILDNVMENYNQTNGDTDKDVFEWAIERSVSQHSDQFDIPFMARLGTQLVQKWMKTPDESPFRGSLKFYRYTYVCAAVKGYGNSDVELKPIFDFITYTFLTFEDQYDVQKMGKSLACSKDEKLLSGLLNSLDMQNITNAMKVVYLEDFPKDILAKKPATMTKTVYEFWKKHLLAGSLEVYSFINLLLLMDHNVYKFPGFRDEVYQFIRDNQKPYYGLFYDPYVQFKLGWLKMKLFRPLPPTVIPPLENLN